MTSRERVERVIKFEKPDRLPFNFWMDRRRMEELNRKYGEDFRVTRFDADELKIRMLNPLQPDLQDVGEFARDYSGRTGIYGGLNTGRIHLMTPEQIRSHVADLFEKAGQGGGLIVSSHDLDISTTEEQLDALTGAIKECIYK